jgi:hypothetical protein
VQGAPGRGGGVLEVVPIGDGTTECGCTTGTFPVGGAAMLDLDSVEPGITDDRTFFELRLADGSAMVQIRTRVEGNQRNVISICNGVAVNVTAYVSSDHRRMRFAMNMSGGSVVITPSVANGAGATTALFGDCVWSNPATMDARISFGAVAAVQPSPAATYFDNLAVACP